MNRMGMKMGIETTERAVVFHGLTNVEKGKQMRMTKGLVVAAIVGICGLVAGFSATAQANVIYGNAVDGTVRDDGNISLTTTGYLQMGAISYANHSAVGVFVFQLPTLAANEQIATASFSDYVQGSGVNGYQVDLYGLNYRTSPALLGTEYYGGPSGSAPVTDALIQDGYIVGAVSGNIFTTSATGNANLATYLNAQLSAAQTNGDASSAYVFLRVSPNTASIYISKWTINTSEASNIDNSPQITYTTEVIPEPVSLALLGLGSLVIFKRRRA